MTGPSRRRLLAVVGGTIAVGAVGCLGDDANDTEETEPALESHPGDGPIEVPDGKICDGVCGMSAEEPAAWVGQLAHDDGTGAFFCSVGCLVAYVAAPEYAEGNDAPVTGAWVPDYVSKDVIDGLGAHYALEDDEDYEHEPMGINPRPFAAYEEAIAYVDSRERLTEDDIIEFPDFDLETARIYRGNRLPNPD